MAKDEDRWISGKGKSVANRFGVRRTEAASGLELAPRSIRKGKFGRKHRYMKDCKKEQLVKAGVIE